MDWRGIGLLAPRLAPTNRANHGSDESDLQSDYVLSVSSNLKSPFISVIAFSQKAEFFTFSNE